MMKTPLLLCLLTLPLSAGLLPSTGKQPWVAFYSAYQRKDFQFTINVEGQGDLLVNDEKGKAITSRYGIRFIPLVEDTLPDGKVVPQAAAKDGWEAVTPAAINPGKVSYRGTTAGGTSFEVNFEFSGDEIRAGGKILEAGKLKNPRFVLRVQMPDVYYYDKDPEKLEAKAKNDRIDLVRADGKKLKLASRKALDAESTEVSGGGVSQAKIEMAGFRGRRLEFQTGKGSSFELWNKGIAPLSEGFQLNWRPDVKAAAASADKEGFVLKLR